MLNIAFFNMIVTELWEGGLETRHFKVLFSKPSHTTRVNNMMLILSTFFLKIISQFCIIENRRKFTFLPFAKNCYNSIRDCVFSLRKS